MDGSNEVEQFGKEELASLSCGRNSVRICLMLSTGAMHKQQCRLSPLSLDGDESDDIEVTTAKS